ncbi:hypothetical protein SteCoe_34711 [Stentor coeruleus]|uniref:Palmitoyltransferase n=1 Tax=Stentor coeruleus TaxID=5963 RepID=A0A1R2ATW9_9CILI|nr:hypothetical protein SteCoe_34711 [Stentor coeruleus]
MKKEKNSKSEDIFKAYNLWPGKSKFFCKGKVMMGPNIRRSICSFSMILIPEILFLCTTGRYFSHKPMIIIVSFLLYCLSLYFHIKVSTSDPGYIPKQLPPFAKGPNGAPTLVKAMLQNPRKECALHKSYVEISFNGRMLKMKYCSACKI